MLAPPKFIRSEKNVNLIKESKIVVIDKNEKFIVDGTKTGINVPIFLYNLQQLTKKLSNLDYFRFLEALKDGLVINSNAKNSIPKTTQRVTKQKVKKKNSYINQLQSFVQTINSRVNRVMNFAPNKVTKKNVPYLISLIFVRQKISLSTEVLRWCEYQNGSSF